MNKAKEPEVTDAGTIKKIKKKKPGRVVRLTPDLVRLVAENQQEGESIPGVIRRLLSIKEEITGYALPSDIHKTVADAKGIAILRAIRTRKPEKPVKVKIL